MRVYHNQYDHSDVLYGHWQSIGIGVDIVYADMQSLADHRMALKIRDRMKNFRKTEYDHPFDSFEHRIYILNRCKRCGTCVQNITSNTSSKLNLLTGKFEFNTKKYIVSYNVCPMCGEPQELCDSSDRND